MDFRLFGHVCGSNLPPYTSVLFFLLSHIGPPPFDKNTLLDQFAACVKTRNTSVSLCPVYPPHVPVRRRFVLNSRRHSLYFYFLGPKHRHSTSEYSDSPMSSTPDQTGKQFYEPPKQLWKRSRSVSIRGGATVLFLFLFGFGTSLHCECMGKL